MTIPSILDAAVIHPRGRAVPARKTEAAAREAVQARLVQELQQRDREVRSHERAHAATAGGLALGGPRFEYTRGPDGRYYATGGEVSLDVTPVAGDPRATLEKADRIRRAALAPANPSQQDRAVAARATTMAVEARLELQRAAREDESRRPGDTGRAPDGGWAAVFHAHAAVAGSSLDTTV